MACGCAAAWPAANSTSPARGTPLTNTWITTCRKARTDASIGMHGALMTRYETQQLYIHGARVDASGGNVFETINPANGEVLAQVQRASQADVERAVASAEQGQREWTEMTAMQRSRILRRAVDILRARNDELALLETHDTGKPYAETSTVDIATGADVLEYYA